MWASESMRLAVDYLYNSIQDWPATKSGLVEVRLEKLDNIETWVRGTE